MPKRKDVLLIAAVIAIAAGMLLVSNFMPKTDLSGKTADVTLAPEAVEYIETPAPIAEPTKAPVSVETEAGTAEPSAPEKPAVYAGSASVMPSRTPSGSVIVTSFCPGAVIAETSPPSRIV